MGFFSDIKNAVTGGGAKVQLQCPEVHRGRPTTVKIWAQAESDGNVNGVYLLVRAIERAQLSDTDFSDGQTQRETVSGSHTSYEHRIPVAGAFLMRAGQQDQWQVQLQLPQEVGPSLKGHLISHEWAVSAGLDMSGNDPDSGWITIQVY